MHLSLVDAENEFEDLELKANYLKVVLDQISADQFDIQLA